VRKKRRSHRARIEPAVLRTVCPAAFGNEVGAGACRDGRSGCPSDRGGTSGGSDDGGGTVLMVMSTRFPLSGIITFLVVLVSFALLSCAGAGTGAKMDKANQSDRVAERRAEGAPVASGEGAVDRFTLPNGLTVLVEENHSSPVVALNVWVKTGSACEREGEYGLAHVHEHMVFKGTGKRGVGEIARVIESHGGDINAFTSYDYTVYYVEIASRFVDTALDVLSDAMMNAAFDAAELKRELEVIVEEIRRGEDSPTRVLSERLFERLFEGHPYGRPIIGTRASVRALTREKVLDFYRRWYRPRNMVLVVVGDVDRTEMRRKIESAFGPMRDGRPARCDVPSAEGPAGGKGFVMHRRVHEGYFSLGFRTVGVMSPDMAALDVLANILGGGESSRLVREIKEEKGLVNNIYAYSYTPRYAGAFVVGGSLDPGKTRQALTEVLKAVFALRHKPPEPRELEKAKLNIEVDSIYAKETMNGQAQKLGFFEVAAGDYRYERTYLERVRAVTAEDVMRVARTYFTPSNLTAGVLFPEGETPVDAKGLVRLAERASAEAAAARNEEEGAGTEKMVVLPNGVKLIVKERHDVPLVALRAALMGGVRQETPRTNGVSNFVAEMLTRGTERRTAEQIAEEVESLGGSISGFSGRNSFGVTMEVPSEGLARAFDVFADVVLHPSFPEDEMERARRDILSQIRRENDNLARTAVNLFLSTLFRRHPYGMNPLGTAETVSALGRRELERFYGRLAKPGNLVLAVVGDVDAERVERLVADYFLEMPRDGGPRLRVPRPEPPPRRVRAETLHRPGKEQAHIVLGFQAPSIRDGDSYVMEVLSAVLSGQGGRLFLDLRDHKSLAYSVTSFYTPGLESGFFGVYIGTAPSKKDEAVDGILSELRRLKEEGVTDAELRRAQNYLVGNFEIGLQQNSTQTAKLAFDELYGLGWDDYKRYAERIYAVGREDVARVAARYLDLDAYTLAVVTP